MEKFKNFGVVEGRLFENKLLLVDTVYKGEADRFTECYRTDIYC